MGGWWFVRGLGGRGEGGKGLELLGGCLYVSVVWRYMDEVDGWNEIDGWVM